MSSQTNSATPQAHLVACQLRKFWVHIGKKNKRFAGRDDPSGQLGQLVREKVFPGGSAQDQQVRAGGLVPYGTGWW